MNNREFQCHKCGKIFIVRADDRARTSNYCPICTKKYYEQKMLEQKLGEDAAWQKKKEQDVQAFEDNLRDWNLVSLQEMEAAVNEAPLYVIGNGFDMLHGVRSSYYDFSKTLGKRSSVRFYLENYLKTDDLWADFEAALGKIDIEAMCQPYIIDNFLDTNGAYDEDAGAAEIYMSAEMAVEPITSMSTELMDRFHKWISGLRVNTNDRPLSNIIKGGKVLNFNYTEFVEDLYGVDSTDICYIHGCRKKTGKGRQRLILGHIPGANDAEYEFEDDYSAINDLKAHEQLLYDVQQIALRMTVNADETLTKKCDVIIRNHQSFFKELSDIRQIITIGHSLYPVDWDYFAEIIKCNKDRDRMQWFFGCYGKGDLDRVHIFINYFGISKARVTIFRTDTIPVKILPDNHSKKAKGNAVHRKLLAISDDGKWKVTCEGAGVDIFDKSFNICSCSRIFSVYMSGAVFDSSGTILVLVARGIYAGLFLFRYVNGFWKYIGELEPIPHQGVITRRLQKIMLISRQMVFVYNSRIRKYDVESGKLVYNKASRQPFESSGEDLTLKFRKIYRTGFY